ncbi:MAG: TatD family hydrolase [Spirochaetia bacterium]|nr:TatD family hydrolase [Spirochaetia bacterium]
MRFIDSHFHLSHLQQKGIAIPELMRTLHEQGFAGGLDIGVDPGDLTDRMVLLREYPSVHYAAGIYPSHAASSDMQADLQLLEEQISTYRPHAVGEIGLDYHWGYATAEQQKELCIRQIELADDCSLPVVIHNREADQDMLELLQLHTPKHGLILHCYSSGAEMVEAYAALDAYFSFAGNVTYKSNRDMQKAAEVVPIDKLLIETDSPYLAPIPKRGKICTPAFIPFTYACIAEIRQLSPDHLAESVCLNYFRLFPAKNV